MGEMDASDAVRDLLRRASEHPLGPEFVQRGSLDAVCATFGVHAFVVDAARDELRAQAARPSAPQITCTMPVGPRT